MGSCDGNSVIKAFARVLGSMLAGGPLLAVEHVDIRTRHRREAVGIA